MRPLVGRVDRLQRLAVFEAAARSGSFSAAGRELGMAQPAVSRHVQALERSLGVSLFEREANRSVLSEAGRTLLAGLDVGFSSIEQTIDDITRVDDVFVLAMPPGFAQQLVVPHLDTLQECLGQRDLRLWLYDREHELDNGRFDAAVRVTDADWDGFASLTLFPERVMPVATPSLALRLGLDAESSADDVIAAPLLHMDATGRPWLSWSDWLAAFDLALTTDRPRVEFNNYPTVLQQALAGRGVALGWAGLIDDLIDDGLLTVVGPEVRSSRSYSLTWSSARPGQDLDDLRSWFTEVIRR